MVNMRLRCPHCLRKTGFVYQGSTIIRKGKNHVSFGMEFGVTNPGDIVRRDVINTSWTCGYCRKGVVVTGKARKRTMDGLDPMTISI
ncbi:MAG: hypothetical protein LBG06_00880 [Deltaproteobacteria bacterium]|jgi:hypothetical protein|nr:hypothetical protein [Deltaproteobacteria bacterium]